MKSLLIIFLLFTSSVQALEFDVCKDTVIDQTKEIAYGQHGIPYSGKIICFRDEEKTILKYKRYFVKGKPIGRHICFDEEGIANESVSYDNSGKKKHGYNYTAFSKKWNYTIKGVDCPADITAICWRERPCDDKLKDCSFKCE